MREVVGVEEKITAKERERTGDEGKLKETETDTVRKLS